MKLYEFLYCKVASRTFNSMQEVEHYIELFSNARKQLSEVIRPNYDRIDGGGYHDVTLYQKPVKDLEIIILDVFGSGSTEYDVLKEYDFPPDVSWCRDNWEDGYSIHQQKSGIYHESIEGLRNYCLHIESIIKLQVNGLRLKEIIHVNRSAIATCNIHPRFIHATVRAAEDGTLSDRALEIRRDLQLFVAESLEVDLSVFASVGIVEAITLYCDRFKLDERFQSHVLRIAKRIDKIIECQKHYDEENMYKREEDALELTSQLSRLYTLLENEFL